MESQKSQLSGVGVISLNLQLFQSRQQQKVLGDRNVKPYNFIVLRKMEGAGTLSSAGQAGEGILFHLH